MNTGTFIRRALADLPRRSGWLVLPAAAWRPQLRLLSGGLERRQGEVYDWDAAKRPPEPMAVLQITLDGEGRLRAGGREWAVRAGQTMVLTTTQPHRYWLPAGGSWEFLFLSLAGADAIAAVEQAIARGGPLQEFLPDGAFLPRALAATRALVRGEITGWGRAAELAMGLLTALVADVDGRDRRHPGIEQAKRLMRRRLQQPPKLAELARAAGLSRSGFCSAFAAAEGLAPGRWLREARLVAAAERLRHGAAAASVARDLGFADPAYFGRAFRRRFGLPPAAWRRQEAG